MNYWVGTSGFQYPEWKGKFYPEGMSAKKMLPYYAERLGSTEVNYTFRRIPSAKAIEQWFSATPSNFRFSFKAPQRVTHFAKLRGCAELMAAFSAALGPMAEKAGCVLFQLPPTFARNGEILRSFLTEMPPGLRTAFEFRHQSWFTDETYAILAEAGAALCIAESEELATPAVSTAPFGYLRLRREDYTAAKLQKWASRVAEEHGRWSDVFVYFKHEEQGLGPRFARQFLGMPAGA